MSNMNGSTPPPQPATTTINFTPVPSTWEVLPAPPQLGPNAVLVMIASANGQFIFAISRDEAAAIAQRLRIAATGLALQ